MANQTRRRAVSILLPSYTAKTGQTATVLHARSVGLVIHKEHNVPKEELLRIDGLVTEILPDARITAFSSTVDISSSPTLLEE